jgi:glycine/D-amino acid oxidase-like deaminating enzyme
MLQIFETQEMLGLYGKSPTSMGNYYIATGDCGHILTGGTLAGMIISGEFLDHYPHVPALTPCHA